MVERLVIERRLGALAGGLIGLALAAGLWGPNAIGLWPAHVPLLYPTLLIGLAAIVVIGVLAGWLAALSSRSLAGAAIWLAAAAPVALLAGHLPFEILSFLTWLADRQFWGLPIYPFDNTAQARLGVASLPLALVLIVLGLAQDYRLDGIIAALDRRRLSLRAWVLLLLPLPLVVAAGLAADGAVNRPLREPLAMVAQVIPAGRNPSADLDALSQQTGLNYNAIVGVRTQLSDRFELMLGEVDLGEEQVVVVVAHFDNGAWINCRALVDRLSFCEDAQAPYTKSLQALLAGQDISQCQDCQMTVSADWQAWLRDHGRFTGQPQVTRLAQEGSYVLMRAANPGSGYAVQCLFHGNRTISLVQCQEE